MALGVFSARRWSRVRLVLWLRLRLLWLLRLLFRVRVDPLPSVAAVAELAESKRSRDVAGRCPTLGGGWCDLPRTRSVLMREVGR